MTIPDSPAALRNREPIFDVLTRVLPETGVVLEVASGTGTHAAYFCERFIAAGRALRWAPSDVDPELRAAVAARREALGDDLRARLRAPVPLDTSAPATWPDETFAAIFCANMVHIAPPAAGAGLFALAGARLPAGAPLVTYGPYRIGGVMAESNARFDASLKARDPRWGVRDLEWLEEHARAQGLALEETIPMPANNHMLVWRRA